MIDDPRFSSCTLFAVVAWIVAMTTLTGAWFVWLMGSDPHLSILLAVTACALTGVAGVAHLRVLAGRTWRLVRVGASLERPDAELREFPRR